MEKSVSVTYPPFNSSNNILNLTTEGLEALPGDNITKTAAEKAFIAVLSLILVFGVLGNFAFFLVVARVRNMRTVVNCYLVNLAIVDCFTLTVGIVLDIRPDIYFHNCMLGAIIYFIPLYVSMFTIAIISIERYLAICHPLRTYSTRKSLHAMLLLGAAWTLAILFDVPQAVPCFYFDSDRGGYVIPNSLLIASLLSVIVSFSLVMVVVTVLNVLIVRAIRNPNRLNRSLNKGKRQVVRLLVITALTFFILLFPEMVFHLFIILLTQEGVITFYLIGNTAFVINFVARSLMYLNSAVNPIIYNLSSQKYRRAFKMAFTQWKHPTLMMPHASSTMRSTRHGSVFTDTMTISRSPGDHDSRRNTILISIPLSTTPEMKASHQASPKTPLGKILMQSPDVPKLFESNI